MGTDWLDDQANSDVGFLHNQDSKLACRQEIVGVRGVEIQTRSVGFKKVIL